MRKISIIGLALILLICSMGGCSGKMAVPDRILEWAVEDYLQSSRYLDRNYTECKTNTSHSFDSETKTDTVKIELILEYPRYVSGAVYNAVYQYDKSEDQWNCIRGGVWEQGHSISVRISDSMNEWTAELKKNGLTGISENNVGEFIGRFFGKRRDELKDDITEGWCLCVDGRDDDAIFVACIKYTDEETASLQYDRMKNRYDITNEDSGLNYRFLREEYPDTLEYLVCNGRAVFVVYADLEQVDKSTVLGIILPMGMHFY